MLYKFDIIVEIKDRLTFENFREHIQTNHDTKLYFWYNCIDCKIFYKFEINANEDQVFYLGFLWNEYRNKFGL